MLCGHLSYWMCRESAVVRLDLAADCAAWGSQAGRHAVRSPSQEPSHLPPPHIPCSLPIACRQGVFGAEVRAPPRLLQRAQGGHARAPLGLHAPEAPAALHEVEAAQGARRGRNLPRRQVPYPGRGLRVAAADGALAQRRRARHARRQGHLPPLRPLQPQVQPVRPGAAARGLHQAGQPDPRALPGGAHEGGLRRFGGVQVPARRVPGVDLREEARRVGHAGGVGAEQRALLGQR